MDMEIDPKTDQFVRSIFSQSPELDTFYKNARAKWLLLAVTDILLLAGDAEVKFLDVVVVGDEMAYMASFSVFTKDLLITVKAKVSGDDEGHTALARRRSELRTIGVAAKESIFDTAKYGSGPGKIRVTLDYGDGEKLELPGDLRVNYEHNKELAEFLSSLRGDLTRPTS
jgi:hypothetical protein